MSNHYTTEPPPTASARLDTTAGPIHISLFAKQTPIACRNFLQHILDGYYENTIFHRVVPGFVVQGGDPTGTGSGGTSIYEDREFEIDPTTSEKVVFGDELHSRLRFNRRGLLGMAKTVEGAGDTEYGSQFFITLADCRAILDRKCTLFGRVEGDGIYNVVKIAEAEIVQDTDRPVYPFKITGGEVLELPRGDIWQNMKKRERIATVSGVTGEASPKPIKKKLKKKAGKALLSFADEGSDTSSDVTPTLKVNKPKFNTTLVADREAGGSAPKDSSSAKETVLRQESRPPPSPNSPSKVHRRNSSKSPSSFPDVHSRKPSFHESMTKFPLLDPESPSNSSTSPSPPPQKTTLADTNAQIAALKASMRRDIPLALEPKVAKSALERMIPSTSIKGRKRKRPGAADPASDSAALSFLDSFKARLDSAATDRSASSKPAHANGTASGRNAADGVDEEAALCDLHFISNCLSCHQNDAAENGPDKEVDDPNGSWMSHSLSFAKDRLGKDLTWKKKNEEELVVIDPREKEKEIKTRERGKKGKG